MKQPKKPPHETGRHQVGGEDRQVTRRCGMGAGKPEVIILTGACQSGKSTLLSALASLLRVKGMKVAGIVAVGLWQDNRRAGFDLIDLADGRTTPLSRRTTDDGLIDGVPFCFVEAGLEAGFEALSIERCAGADFIIIDEVGILEIRGLGWAGCLAPLLELDGPVHIWVVRKDCLEEVMLEWGLCRAEVVTVEGPDALNRLMSASLEKSESIR
jgi:nucleoside-triphosphatase THEP1